jgi:membrane protein DedA with SNARE-associated domain
VAANALGAVCSGAIWVFTRIFDLSSVTVEVPTHIGFFALVILLAIAIMVGQGLALRKKPATA